MSGGVDSSIAAYLLKQEYREVIGVFLRLWRSPREWNSAQRCIDEDEECLQDVRKVAEEIGIELVVQDVADEFKTKIVDPFVVAYLEGKTPNPCVICNEEIKLTRLMDEANRRGAEAVATGHYARVQFDKEIRRYVLLRALDQTKDQSYYLARITKQRLPYFKTPLGDKTKQEIKRLADELGLHSARKKESQEVCFIRDPDYRTFVANYARRFLQREIGRPGKIVDTEGNVRGEFEDISFYTIGQRKGLGISAPRPLYVVDIDTERNLVIVGEKDKIFSSGLVAEHPNWLSMEPEDKIAVKVQFRYRHEPADALLRILDERHVEIMFKEPQPAVTPGQLAVWYRDDVLVGSAFITRGVRA